MNSTQIEVLTPEAIRAELDGATPSISKIRKVFHVGKNKATQILTILNKENIKKALPPSESRTPRKQNSYVSLAFSFIQDSGGQAKMKDIVNYVFNEVQEESNIGSERLRGSISCSICDHFERIGRGLYAAQLK